MYTIGITAKEMNEIIETKKQNKINSIIKDIEGSIVAAANEGKTCIEFSLKELTPCGMHRGSMLTTLHDTFTANGFKVVYAPEARIVYFRW